MELVNRDIAAFWNVVMSALETATYVFGGVVIVIFVLMALSELRFRKKLPAEGERHD